MKFIIVLLVITFSFIELSSAAAAAVEGSKCQKQKGLGERRKDAPKLIPECDSNGEYKPLHCFTEGGKKMCQCWHPKTGDLMKGPSATTKFCDCVLARHEAEKKSRTGSIGHHTPRCENDGSFSKRQCSGSTGYCWCTKPSGEKIAGTEKRPEGGNGKEFKCS
ncbi:U20-hexatoxin-Hi1a-like [Brevipalpus obovatus]|uniref:U20-hexatoxin-Hi1a-like n=1 Tax=Brevipalpus obovatus TaxID=246614 RepID=UPI003D9DC8A9